MTHTPPSFLPSSPKVDKIVVMGQLPGTEGATIVDQGTYEELVGRGRDFSNILDEQKSKEEEPAEAEVSSMYTFPYMSCVVCPINTDI